MRPGLGEIIFQDDFSTGEGWTLSSTAKGNVALGKNKLTIAISASKSYLFSLRSQPIVGGFYAEITASPNLCRGVDEYGLLIRAASEQDYYRFSVSCDGQTRLDRVYQGTASSPQPWMLGSMVPVGAPSTSRLAVWAVGKEMRFFINDEYQFTVRDPLLPSGRLGVFARSAGDTAVTVNFSDLVVRAIGGSATTTAPSVTPSPIGTATPTRTATIPPETRLRFQCLEVEASLSSEIASSGIVVLESRVNLGNARNSPDTFLLNMLTGKATQIALQEEYQSYHFVSPGRKLLVFESVKFNSQGKITQNELVVATADGQRLKVIPSEEG